MRGFAIRRAGTSKPYTGHCLRASYISYGHDAGLSFADLAHKTGHRSESGMAPYRCMMPEREKAVQNAVVANMLGKRLQADALDGSALAPQQVLKQSRTDPTPSSSSPAVSEQLLSPHSDGPNGQFLPMQRHGCISEAANKNLALFSIPSATPNIFCPQPPVQILPNHQQRHLQV